MNMNSKHGKRVMDSVVIQIIVTPEELQSVITDLDRMRRRCGESWNVETQTLINALQQAAIPVTRTKPRVPRVA